MAYEWDMGKASMNFAKHGVLFTDAVDFEWDRAMGWVDARRDCGEAREIAVAPLCGRMHVMVFTRRCGKIRIISLRKANQREMEAYERSVNQC
ncbi:MAG: BrnT family toxin [Magnetococcales bacterium]|nr:BrnT family toxin [Magnetococcales bacterium]